MYYYDRVYLSLSSKILVAEQTSKMLWYASQYTVMPIIPTLQHRQGIILGSLYADTRTVMVFVEGTCV